MKKRVVAMLVLAMLVTGCGVNGGSDASGEQASAAEQASEQVTEQAIEEASEQASEQVSREEPVPIIEESNEEASTETSETPAKEAAANTTSGLKDGKYNADLVPAPTNYSSHYVKSVSFTEDTIIIEAPLYQFDANWNVIEFDMAAYTLATNADTQYISGGGEQEPTHMSREEFKDYLSHLMDSGLGLSFSIENGYVKQIGIWS